MAEEFEPYVWTCGWVLGRPAGFCTTLLGQHWDTLTLCSIHFKPNATLSSTEFEPKSIPYLVQL